MNKQPVFHKRYGGRLSDRVQLTIMTAMHASCAVCGLSFGADDLGAYMTVFPDVDEAQWYPVVRFMCTHYSSRITRITWMPVVGRMKPRTLPGWNRTLSDSCCELSVRNDEAPRYLYGVTLECMRRFRPNFKKAIHRWESVYDNSYDRSLIIDPGNNSLGRYIWSPLGDKAYAAELKAKGKKSGYCSQ